MNSPCGNSREARDSRRTCSGTKVTAGMFMNGDDETSDEEYLNNLPKKATGTACRFWFVRLYEPLAELRSAEEVEVQMRNSLTAVGTGVCNHAVSVTKPFGHRNFRHNLKAFCYER